MTDWSILIDALRVQSGEPVHERMSDEMAAFLDERFGLMVSEAGRTFARTLPRVTFGRGLEDSEIDAIQTRLAFRFPPDLRVLLQTALPVGDSFPNWRGTDEQRLRDWLRAPLDGVCFDVEHNGFWDPEWGERPESLAEALRVCRALVSSAPQLIPIYGHRYIPSEPIAVGNPVFSVHQTDIICYGYDLEDYLRNEFKLGDRGPWPDEVRQIRFWDIDRWQGLRWSDTPQVYWNR